MFPSKSCLFVALVYFAIVLSVSGQYEDDYHEEVGDDGIAGGYFHFNPTYAHDDPSDFILHYPPDQASVSSEEESEADGSRPGSNNGNTDGAGGNGGGAAGDKTKGFGMGTKPTFYSRRAQRSILNTRLKSYPRIRRSLDHGPLAMLFI